jgi:hypothetical protein
MARITPQTARLLADELIRAGGARVGERDALIRQMLAQSEATGDASPETALGNALMMTPPRTLTPAAPAKPGVPLVAPKPVAEAPQRAAPRPSRFTQSLDSTLRDMSAIEDRISQAQASGQKNTMLDEARLDALRQRAGILQDYVRAEEGAEIPEEMRAAMDNRQARIARREELLAEDKARSPWEALIAGGAALAQGRRGERFTEALTRGLQAGLQDYGRSRRANIEGTEEIGEARDQAVIDRYNALDKARADAVNMINSGMKIDKDIADLAGSTDATLLRRATMGDVISRTASDAAKAAIEVQFLPEEKQAGIKEMTSRANYYNAGGGRGDSDVDKPMTENQRQTKIQQLMLKRNDYAVKLAQAKLFGSAGAAELGAAIKAIDERLLALKTGGGATPGLPSERIGEYVMGVGYKPPK